MKKDKESTVLYPIVSTCTIQFTDRRGETEWIGGGGEAGVPFYLLKEGDDSSGKRS